jgi:putative nucleotidyltransferase with HDIG domain
VQTQKSSRFPLLSYKNPTLWILLPLALYALVRIPPLLSPELVGVDPHLAHPAEHFVIVSATALISLVLSFIVGIIGGRQRNLQVIYVSIAFISLAAFFSVHGLATPGFILGGNSVVGVASQLSVLTMSFWLLISSLPTDHPASAWLSSHAGLLLPLYTPVILVLSIIALANPGVADWIPVSSEPVKYIVGALTLVMAGLAARRYWESYRYSRFPFQLAIAYTAGWICVVQIIMTTGQTFYASWWIYHFLLLFAVITVLAGLYVQYRRGDSLVRSILGLFSHDPGERLAAGISPSVRELIMATEARDPYTAGHSYRVAEGALELGSALKLPPEELRVLAQGGLVHDVGKMDVPDEILNKPGPLTPAERKQIENHTVAGYELCARLGFMPPELAIIRSHHERVDGRGYPDGVSHQDLPISVRVLSVIDVWDALTSARSYRPAWSNADAIAYLQENRGSQFDPVLVDTWIDLVSKRNK